MPDVAGFTAMLKLLRAAEAVALARQATDPDPARSADGSYHRACSCAPWPAVLVHGRVRMAVTVAHDDGPTALVVGPDGAVWREATVNLRPADGAPAGWRVWPAPDLPD